MPSNYALYADAAEYIREDFDFQMMSSFVP
jgi:hypothetical protein